MAKLSPLTPPNIQVLCRLQSFKIIIIDIKLYSVREVVNGDAQHEFDEVTPYQLTTDDTSQSSVRYLMVYIKEADDDLGVAEQHSRSAWWCGVSRDRSLRGQRLSSSAKNVCRGGALLTETTFTAISANLLQSYKCVGEMTICLLLKYYSYFYRFSSFRTGRHFSPYSLELLFGVCDSRTTSIRLGFVVKVKTSTDLERTDFRELLVLLSSKNAMRNL